MNEERINKTNIGISLLKMLMAFEVVLAHFCKWGKHYPIYLYPFKTLVSLAVPVFFVISFYFAEPLIIGRNTNKKINRISRLFTPQLFWAIVYFVFFFLLDSLSIENNNLSVADLLFQIITGHSSKLNSAMWFQFDLIMVTVLFYIVFSKLNTNKGYIVIVIISFICVVLQITGINYNIFSNMIFELKYPLGRIVETIPFACIGFSLKYFNILETLKKHYLFVIPACLVLFFVGLSIDWILFDDFGYGGFAKLYLSSLPVIAAYVFPFEKLSSTAKSFILSISSNTLGIYCCHIMVAKILELFVPVLYSETFGGCLIIYSASFVLCLLIKAIVPNAIKHIC